ncbi:MAG: carboxylating nicotinate-nucleotide diphosphorylase [Actinomycetes bacterium]
MSYPESRLTRLEQVQDLVAAVGLDEAALADIVADALAEDLGGRGVLPPGSGAGVDVTSVATIDADATTSARFVVRAPGLLAGAPVAAYVMALVCGEAGPFRIDLRIADGSAVVRGDVIMTVGGNTRALLRAERVALNLLTQMSGVATATRTWVEALAGTSAQVRDSRKTVPGLRMLQKYAVRVAGGVNHRMSLADAALIKDNHVVAAGGVVEAYRAVRASFPEVPVQVEVTSLEQARAVVAAGADDVLLDNMSLASMRQVVAELRNRARFEASGGLTLTSAVEVAATGVNSVAVGSLTHSAPVLDIALDFVTTTLEIG